jgi:3D (Asp-Asp-Asp) domain-containing protein
VKHATWIGLLLVVLLRANAGLAESPANGSYVATAYSQSGLTASGIPTQRHVVAADPDVLPIGSRIKIKKAGRYSGEYVVADTGRKIQGRRLDIYMPSERSCTRFGRKRVMVRVIQLGDGTKQGTQTADNEIKKDVQNELKKKAVGGAATEEDWAAKKAGSPSATPTSTDRASSPETERAKTPE